MSEAAPHFQCGKRPFRSETTATRTLLQIWIDFPNDPVRREIRVYECPRCAPTRWHLTSIPTEDNRDALPGSAVKLVKQAQTIMKERRHG